MRCEYKSYVLICVVKFIVDCGARGTRTFIAFAAMPPCPSSHVQPGCGIELDSQTRLVRTFHDSSRETRDERDMMTLVLECTQVAWPILSEIVSNAPDVRCRPAELAETRD